MNGDKLKILIADPQYLIRVGLRQLLSSSDCWEVVGEVADRNSLYQWLEENHSDVVLLDYGWTGDFSPADVRRIRREQPDCEVVVISSDLEKEKVVKAQAYGAKGFLTKACDEEEIMGAIEAVAQKEKFFCNKVLNILLPRDTSKIAGKPCDPTRISEREIEIIRCMAAGLKADEIARRLSLSKHTVYTHRKNIKRKLALRNAAEIVHYAVKANLVD